METTTVPVCKQISSYSFKNENMYTLCVQTNDCRQIVTYMAILETVWLRAKNDLRLILKCYQHNKSTNPIYWIYMYKEKLALNQLQWLICHKTQPYELSIMNYCVKLILNKGGKIKEYTSLDTSYSHQPCLSLLNFPNLTISELKIKLLSFLFVNGFLMRFIDWNFAHIYMRKTKPQEFNKIKQMFSKIKCSRSICKLVVPFTL